MRRMLSLLMAVSVVGLMGCAHTLADEIRGQSQTNLEPSNQFEEEAIISCFRGVYSNILFRFDSAQLSGEAMKVTDDVVFDLKDHYIEGIIVEGHTCDIGTSDYNLALGAKRALAVRDYVIRQGIDPSRVTITSYGEEAPAVRNDSESNRRLNRRAVFKFKAGEYPELDL